MSNHSSISAPLAEEIARDGGWDQASVDATHTYDLLIESKPGKADEAARHAKSVDANVEDSYGDTVHVTAEARNITNLASGNAVRLVEERPEFAEHSISEGVQTTNADDLHNDGITGAGVTVAVIDLQFNPDQSEIKDQVVATIGDSSNFQSGTTGLHGTACAEIVSEMLPDADLVLASAAGTFFPTLMDDITSQTDPDVMSMSLGYKPTKRLDGNDDLSNRIADYTSGSGSNTSDPGLFAVSAGNEADGAHWDGPYRTDSNGYLEFDDAGSTYLEVSTMYTGQSLVVQSDADWSTDQDYSLELYDANKNLIKSPPRTSTPAQEISLPGTTDINVTTTSYLRIVDENLDGTEHFDVFTWGNYVDLPSSTSKRSIGIPGTSPDANTLTVGAVEHASDELEPFSSRGPTQDGRRGVDIVAPDGTQSDAYSGEFFGTSAACPHVAGAAGLLSEDESYANTDVRESLYATARDISDSSVAAPTNRKIGYGYVDAKAAYEDLTVSLSVSASGETISAGGTATLSVSASGVDQVTVRDLWTDWSVDSTQTDGGSFTDNISGQGSGDFSWSSTQDSASPSLTVDLPSRYAGGTYVMTVTGTGPDGTAETTATIDIS